jgi:hypothetical protein
MKKLVIIFCFAAIWFVFLANAARADETKIGFVKNVTGEAFIGRGQALISAKVNEKLLVNDNLITGADGSIGVILQDNSVLSLGPKSRVNLSKFSFDPVEEKISFVAKIGKGTLVYLTGLMAKINRKAVRFETPTAVCGVRGTHFAIKVDAPDDDAGK